MKSNKIKSGKTTTSLVNKLLQKELRDRLTETVDRLCQSDYSFPPVAALVDITSKCNLNCSWCIDRYTLSNEEISTERMLDILDEFKSLTILSIVYFGGGEPLVHPGIIPILRKTKRLGIDYAINTNGILLSGEVASVIGEDCSWTRISLDAGCPEAYKKLHDGRDFFNQIINNVENLIKIAKGTVGISFVVMDCNIKEIGKMTEFAKKIGCDFIQFKPEYTPLESNKRMNKYYESELSLEIKEQLNKAKQSEDDEFGVLITGSLQAIINREPINQNKTYQFCAAQQFIPLITPHGVYVCPNWRGANERSVGDIRVDSLINIWYSNKRKEIIENLNCSKECELYCLRHQINVLVNKLIEAENMGFGLIDYLKEIPGEELSDRYFI